MTKLGTQRYWISAPLSQYRPLRLWWLILRNAARAVAAQRRLQANVRRFGQRHQRGLVVERHIPGDRFERERAVHRPALEVNVIQFASEPRGNRALASARWTINGDNQFARFVCRVFAHCRSKIVHACFVVPTLRRPRGTPSRCYSDEQASCPSTCHSDARAQPDRRNPRSSGFGKGTT